MSRPPVIPDRRESLGNRALDAGQQQLAEVSKILRGSLFLKGRVVSVKLAAGVAKSVRHGLGVQAAFFPVRRNYDGTGNHPVIDEALTSFQATLDQTTHLGVIASVACTVDLYFYPAASQSIDAATGQSP